MAPPAVDLGRTFVRVLGTRHDRFVEFEFAINDQDLSIELVMPFAAFREFCAENRCEIAAVDGDAQVALERLAWREGRPGLYRRPEDRPENRVDEETAGGAGIDPANPPDDESKQ